MHAVKSMLRPFMNIGDGPNRSLAKVYRCCGAVPCSAEAHTGDGKMGNVWFLKLNKHDKKQVIGITWGVCIFQ